MALVNRVYMCVVQSARQCYIVYSRCYDYLQIGSIEIRLCSINSNI